MTKGLGLHFVVSEVKEGFQNVEVEMDISRVSSSSTKAKEQLINVTIQKQKGTTVDLDAKVRTIRGDSESNSSMVINVPEEILNVHLKVSGTNPGSSTGGKNLSSILLPQSRLEPTVRLSPEDLKKKMTSLIEDYFTNGLLHKVSQFIEELRSPSYHPEIVKECILLGLKKKKSMVMPLLDLFEHLLKYKEVLCSYDVIEGCVRCASMIADREFDSIDAPSRFGSLIGNLVFSGLMEFKVVKWILVEFDEYLRLKVFESMMDYFRLNQQFLESHSRDLAACKKLSSYEYDD